ncbi:muscular LMNA-interacting protein isoform X2 [Xiphias gladius]|uniref:muscular LMNA-interacting protein isoform X2 n=1 Tax=Xiphias gladius TaxID=8245 RepID=UPI001A99DD15|nr:muscular LMNA-interacting protein isoform X2 [Xiphias gladius]
MDSLNKSLGKNVAVSHEKTTRETMSDGKIFKAERVFIRDSVEGGAGNIIQPETELQSMPSLEHVSLSHTKASPSVSAHSENTPNHVAAGTASMETAVDKHRGISQWRCHDTSGRAERHKIKLNYKSLAAIPTNTLLLDQQAIDAQVEREESPCDTLERGLTLERGVEDTHAEMCSPAQLRQQSEELYAAIDEILATSIPAPYRSSTTSVGVQQNNSPFPKSFGRETKYASLCSLHPSASTERKLMDPRKTKPGVIRPMTAIPRLTVEDGEEFHPNPFRQNLTDNKKVENMSPEKAGKDFYTSLKGVTMREEGKPERRSPFSLCDLQITEPEDQISQPAKDASASFSPKEGRMEAFETHI